MWSAQPSRSMRWTLARFAESDVKRGSRRNSREPLFLFHRRKLDALIIECPGLRASGAQPPVDLWSGCGGADAAEGWPNAKAQWQSREPTLLSSHVGQPAVMPTLESGSGQGEQAVLGHAFDSQIRVDYPERACPVARAALCVPWHGGSLPVVANGKRGCAESARQQGCNEVRNGDLTASYARCAREDKRTSTNNESDTSRCQQSSSWSERAGQTKSQRTRRLR